MKQNKGQDINVWSDEWNKLDPESEIQMWDFYGLRQWISKYVPRFGKTVEAGCGLGRYNFYFSRMGINIEGLDFSDSTIEFLKHWQKKYGFDINFIKGNVTNMSYEDNSLRGYISLGVVEHFIEGPHKPLAEAYRVLEPGGIAIITTPSVSWNVFLRKVKTKIKNIVKKIIRYKSSKVPFFQHEYRPKKLKSFIEQSGLKVTVFDSADLLYTFTEIGNFSGNNLKNGSFAYWISNKFENSLLKFIGAQSVTISIKTANKMYCFLCGEKNAKIESLNSYTVPLCQNCQQNKLAEYYKKGVRPRYAASYLINPPINPPSKEKCHFSKEEYTTDELFEDYGFTVNVSPDMLQKPEINIKLCNEFIQPIWRKRKND